MKTPILLLMLFASIQASAQLGLGSTYIGVSSGLMNYSGDLKPNSFTFKQSNPYINAYIQQEITPHLAVRAGYGTGSLEASDKNNRGYLVPRNLDFKTKLQEVYAGAELSVFSLQRNRFTPYIFLGAAIFKFNPYTTDSEGNKVYLQPLSTEGQGLEAYPERKVYSLTQRAMIFAGGVKFAVTEDILIGMELSQRKTFTDYIDDVSSNFVDREQLLRARGQKAVDIAFRGDELPGSTEQYPKDGEQRGTPTENDWYYFGGFHAQIKLSFFGQKFRRVLVSNPNYYVRRCPKVF